MAAGGDTRGREYTRDQALVDSLNKKMQTQVQELNSFRDSCDRLPGGPRFVTQLPTPAPLTFKKCTVLAYQKAREQNRTLEGNVTLDSIEKAPILFGLSNFSRSSSTNGLLLQEWREHIATCISFLKEYNEFIREMNALTEIKPSESAEPSTESVAAPASTTPRLTPFAEATMAPTESTPTAPGMNS